MGVFDTLINLFGFNLETRLKKAVAVVVVLVVVVIVMGVIDPLAELFLNAMFGYPTPPLEAHLSIPEIMDDIMAIWTPLAPMLSYIRDSTIWGVFFFLGMVCKVLALVVADKFGSFGTQLSALGGYFNDQRDIFGKRNDPD